MSHHRLSHWMQPFALAASLATAALCTAHAGTYPDHPIRIIVPYSPGGSSDVPMRVIAAQMAKQMHQGIIVENMPGSGSMLGVQYVSHAAPDGYTLLLASNPQAIGATLYKKKLNFDPIGVVTPISLFTREPGVLVVNPALPVHNIGEFIRYVKARPGRVDFASSGNGSAQHLFMEMFLSRAGLDMVHIPYSGSAQATTDVVGGQVPAVMPGLSAMIPYIRDHQLRALAVTGDHRSPLLPDVPTLAESGFPGFSAYVWSGLVAPKGTPQAVIDKLNRELREAVNTPSVQAFIANQSLESITDTPAQFQTFLNKETQQWAEVIHTAGVSIN